MLHNIVKADVASLYPSIMLSYGIGPESDQLGAFGEILAELTKLRLYHKDQARRAEPGSRERQASEALSEAMKVLINSFYGSLGTSFALFGDLRAAGEVTRRGREVLSQMLQGLERRGLILIEADTDGVLFSVPDGWTEKDEHALIAELNTELPAALLLSTTVATRRCTATLRRTMCSKATTGRSRSWVGHSVPAVGSLTASGSWLKPRR